MIAYLSEQGEKSVQSTHLWHIVELSRKRDAIKEDKRKKRSAGRIDARPLGYAHWQSDGKCFANGNAGPWAYALPKHCSECMFLGFPPM
jgi:hypothetical protein